jgi:hypothetical protein
VIRSGGIELLSAALQVFPGHGQGVDIDLLADGDFSGSNTVTGSLSVEPGEVHLALGLISDGKEAVKRKTVHVPSGKRVLVDFLFVSSDFAALEKLWISGSAVPDTTGEMTKRGGIFTWSGILHEGSFKILSGQNPSDPETASCLLPGENPAEPGEIEQPMIYRPGGRDDTGRLWNIDQSLYHKITVYPERLTCTIETSDGWSDQGKAPMYWTVYEYHRQKEFEGVPAVNNYIPEAVFLENINWIHDNLKEYGFDMICVDGWGGGGSIPTNINGYRTTHSVSWTHDYAYWAAYLREKGMSLGMYNNPLWVDAQAGAAGKKVYGTDISISSIYDLSEPSAYGFRWVCVDRPGAEEYVKGYIKYYADMGVKFLRADFLSWYETGTDRNLGVVGKTDRPRSHYGTALRWMREACEEYGVYLSLVMPHLKNDAEYESIYGHMYRINGDTFEGGWNRLSAEDRGQRRGVWSQFENPFDGFVYWSQFAGPGKAIMDGDFLRLNTFANDEERRTAVSLMVMAGSPIAIADRVDADSYTPEDMLPFYQNDELMALAREGFRARPLSHDYAVGNSNNQIWKGQAANGDWIVAFFNREDSAQTRSINFQEHLGIAAGYVRDIWLHNSHSEARNDLSIDVPVHGCKIFRIEAVQ